MECHETKDIARGRIRHIDALVRRNPLWHDDVGDGVEKTLLDELL
jgi:hypothetical protein